MQMEYESEEFTEELKRRINASNEYREKAKGMNWKALVIARDIAFATYTVYENGELKERMHLREDEIEEYRKKADLTVEVPTYDLSVELATGKKTLESQFIAGTLKLEGSIFKALQHRDALEIQGRITAELANESSIPSKEEFVKTLKIRGST